MKTILIILVFLVSLKSWSQAPASVSFTYQHSLALSEFRDTGGRSVGAGARFNFYARPTPTSPFLIGISSGLLGRGQTKKTLPLDIVGYQSNYLVKATNYLLNIGLQLNYEPLTGKRISPYIEGEIGGNDFYSSVYFNLKGKSGSSQRIGKTDDTKEHWGLYYGGSAGVKIAVDKMRTGGIELKCSLFKGSMTSYNAKPRFTKNETLAFDHLRSTTDMLILQIGFWVNLRDAKNEVSNLNHN